MDEDIGPRLHLAAGVTAAILLLSIPMVLIPLVGPILAMTLVPYLSTAIGSRLAHPGDRIPLALMTSVSWSLIESAVILIVADSMASFTGITMGSLEWILIILLWTMNVLFSILGAVYTWKDPFSHLKA